MWAWSACAEFRGRQERVRFFSLCFGLPRRGPAIARCRFRHHHHTPSTLSKMATPRKSSKKASKSVSQSKKAGLVFPVGRVGSMLRKGRYAGRVSRSAAVFLAASLEFLVAETLDLACKSVLQRGKSKRITPRALTLAVRHDADLGELL